MNDARDGASPLGRTIRWTCTDGPVAGQTFEHSFNGDGDDGGTRTRKPFIAVVPVDDDIVVVSSIAASGEALMATLNFANGQMVGFVLSHDSWSRHEARFELLPAP